MLKVYNTMTRKKEEFKPLEPGVVRMYVCGPTTYDFCHIGHARSYVAFDVIRRYLEYTGYSVIYVENFTDVDDKIINRANEIGEDPLKLSKRFIDEALKDFDALGIKRATVHPKVSQHISEIINFIKVLMDKGYAYESNGNVYYDVSKFSNYGKLSNLNPDEMKGSEQDMDLGKKDPRDFALWKKSKPGEPRWESPWGEGRPGWHIECSVMSMKYLGETFDIHGGGRDLIFPHHENEIAQSEAYSGKKFVNYWMHNGFVTINKEKMSKSLGNFFTIREILKKYDPETLRLFLLSTHYRGEIDFSEDSVKESQEKLSRLYNLLERVRTLMIKSDELGRESDEEIDMMNKIVEYKKKFIAYMDDDFNTAGAIATMFEMSKDINKFLDEHENVYGGLLRMIFDQFMEFGKILNIFWKYEKISESDNSSEKLMNILCSIRDDLREKKIFELSDKIREDVMEAGFKIEDGDKGSIWKRNF